MVPFAKFERDAAAGTLPDFSLIEPNFISGHGDYHPAFGRSLGRTVDVTTLDPPSSMLAGEAFLERIFNAYRASTSESGSNVWNTALLIGWDEPGGTHDHVPPGPAPPPDPGAPAGELGFTFDRSGYRVPAILVSPWVPKGSVFNDEYRHTSPRDLGDRYRAPGPGMAPRRRSPQQRAQRPRQEHGTRHHRARPRART
ncbi:MAG: alkaline phosphatase family protein [Solirubrobacteraceae bacterium]